MDINTHSLSAEDHTKTAFYKQETHGYLKITGDDRHAFLQRQTTNDINLLSPERSLVTVLTSPAGRILDVLWVIDENEAFGVLTLPGQGKQTIDFLSSRIFFMDKVSLEDASQDVCRIDLLGQGVSEILQELGSIRNPQDNVTFNFKIDHIPVRVLFQSNIGHSLLIPGESCHQITNELENNGSVQLSPESYEILRIETGFPAAGHELTEDYTPLETGLQWTVSDNKGCYTGQEVIARQVNYDKITRHMVGLLMSDVPKIGDTLYPLDKEQPVGKITSMALSPRYGPIALAIVKRPFHQPGNELVSRSEEQNITTTTTALPFH